ncbi:MAG: hypothetical protein GF309_13435 [Candidatus Lokiarchaeota archaeon]|nr:hypothetical protein [Candidatus Lokiarchaeota archaeon]
MSSAFPESKDAAIDELKLETDIHGVLLSKAEDLNLILNHSLRKPMDFDLRPTGFMALLTEDVVADEERIRSVFSI